MSPISYQIKALVSPEFFHTEDTFKFSHRAESIVETLLKDSSAYFKDYLKVGVVPEELACNLLSEFYNEKQPLYSSLVEVFRQNTSKKTQAIATQEGKNLPSGISYEIFPYGIDLRIDFKFEYNSEEDDINREEITVTVTFQE